MQKLSFITGLIEVIGPLNYLYHILFSEKKLRTT